jgi:predicted O-linked N-acetylglucosamine transferase (SPINDLY family)
VEAHAEAIAPAAVRADYGLPDDAVVLTCQAATYKIVPPVFDAWMRALRRVRAALLWLRPMPALPQRNLRQAAAQRGIDPARLRFAPQEPLPRYRARLRLADLYLDTHPFGSHTTVSDALATGVPVVTVAGRSMAARASASQVRAAGLPELVVASLDAYADLAGDLAADRTRLTALAARLRGPGRAAPLFDRARYAREFGTGLQALWSRHAAHRANDTAHEDASPR